MVQIALAKFKCSHEAVRDALLRLDEDVIKVDGIHRLRECAPSAEELERLAPYASDDAAAARLEPAERFLLLLSRVPRLDRRLSCFLGKLTFAGRLADVHAQVRALREAVSAARGSKVLPELLGHVLRTGNFLNEGSVRGGAHGFETEVLLKLGETKSAVSDAAPTQTSLLHFIARKVVAGRADAPAVLKGELRALDDASSLSSAGVQSDLDALRRDVAEVRSELELARSSSASNSPSADAFVAVMGAHYDKATAELETLQAAAPC